MKRSDVDEVARLAREVAKLADGVLVADKAARSKEGNSAPTGMLSYDVSTMDTAALRRRSLDLTRALARLRNPYPRRTR